MNIIILLALGILLICDQTELLNGKSGINQTDDTILKAILMKCSENGTNSLTNKIPQSNIRISIQMAEHYLINSTEPNNGSFVRKLLLGEVYDDSSRKYVCEIMSPYSLEVSNDDFFLMYPMKFDTLDLKTTRSQKNQNAAIHLAGRDVYNANKLQLLDNIHYAGLKASDFLSEKSDFLHNPKDIFRRDNIYTKNFKKDNNKNNANNEYANEEFYRNKNQRENENAFSGKHSIVTLNNNKIDNFVNKEMNENDDDNINDIGYFKRNLFDDMYSRKHRKNIKVHKNDFMNCVGMKIFKKIDHLLCTCARNQDKTENDERSDCFQLINNVCLWGPTAQHNKDMNEGRRDHGGSMKSRAASCCNLLPEFYLRLGTKCLQRFKENNENYKEYVDLYDKTEYEWPEFAQNRLPDPWPLIIKNQSELQFDQELLFMHSNTDKENDLKRKKFDNSPKSKPHLINDIRLTHQKQKIPNSFKDKRNKHFKENPYYDNNRPAKHRSIYRKEATPIDKDICDPNLNVADKLQLINMINPKKPCEDKRMNHVSFHNRQHKRRSNSEQSPFYNEDLISSLNEDVNEYPDARLRSDQLDSYYPQFDESKDYFEVDNERNIENEESVEEVPRIWYSVHNTSASLQYPFNWIDMFEENSLKPMDLVLITDSSKKYQTESETMVKEKQTIPTEEETINWKGITLILLIFFGFLYILGLLKAILGCCCSEKIGKWKYNFLQPVYKYEKTSLFKRFFINSIFFLVFPCVFICKCFNPTEDDIEQTESTWTRRIIQKEISSDGEQDDEMSKLLKVENEKKESTSTTRVAASDDYSDSIFDSYNAEDEERDTCFVLAALTESKETLKMLESRCSESEETQTDTLSPNNAGQFVKSLLKARLVYRQLQSPVGKIEVSPSQMYSVRGFFLSSHGSKYRFLTQTPVKQYWRIDSQSKNLISVVPPKKLVGSEFNKTYQDKLEVLETKDLSIIPPQEAPCLTISIQNQEAMAFNIKSD